MSMYGEACKKKENVNKKAFIVGIHHYSYTKRSLEIWLLEKEMKNDFMDLFKF